MELVSAINTNSVEVTFNGEVDALTVADLNVSNKATGQKQYVKSVKLSTDKLSATVVFYDKLVNNSSYAFSIKVGEETLSYEYAYAVTDVASISFEAQTVKNGEKVTFKALDANGIELTADVLANLTVVSPSGLIANDGTVNLVAGTSTTAKVVYTNPTTNAKVESNTVTITASAAELAGIAQFTVAGSTPIWTDADYKFNNTIASDVVDNEVYVQLADQFGDVYTLTDNATYKEEVRFESLNTDILVADKLTGAITPMAEGTAPVKVSVVKVIKADGKETVLTSKTVEVNVIATAVAKGLSLSTSGVTVSTLDTVGTTVTGKLVDQYGNAVQTATVAISEGATANDNLTDIANLTTNAKGEFSFTVLPEAGAQAGTYTLEAVFTLGNGTTIKAPLSVTLKVPGAFAGYAVKGLESTIDKNTSAANNELEVSVVSVDSAGLVIEEEAGTVVVTDKTGASVASAVAVDGKTILTTGLTTGETYTATVKLDNKVIKAQTFKVVDTTLKSNAQFTSSILDIDQTGGEALLTELAKILEVKYDGVEASEIVSDIVYVSSDDNVIDDSTDTLQAGSTTIFVKSIVFDRDGAGAAPAETVEFATAVKLSVIVK